MLTSMTGFGRSVVDVSLGQLTIEILSVNRKHLEVFVSLPKEFSRFEHEVRKWVGEKVGRGQIQVRVYLALSPETLTKTLPDLKTLEALKKGWEKIATVLKLDAKAIDLPFLASFAREGSKFEFATDEDLASLKNGVFNALSSLVEMKKKEGKALASDIEGRLFSIEKTVQNIEGLAPDATEKMRKKLTERMKDLFAPGPEIEERLLREVALYAEKSDISEELTRLKSHFGQFHQFLRPKEGGAGRKIEFLLQEMGREINTIGSKSSETAIAHFVVDIKSEIEKIREQIQNIE